MNISGHAWSALFTATDPIKRFLNRRLFCPRGEHRDALGAETPVMVFRCIDCGRVEPLGVAFHASNHRTVRRRRKS